MKEREIGGPVNLREGIGCAKEPSSDGNLYIFSLVLKSNLPNPTGL